MSAYTGTFTGYTISFINSDFSFISESYHFVSPANTLFKATYLRARFLFDKGSTGNIQERTFTASQLIDHPFVPSSRRFAPWTVRSPATSIPSLLYYAIGI